MSCFIITTSDLLSQVPFTEFVSDQSLSYYYIVNSFIQYLHLKGKRVKLYNICFCIFPVIVDNLVLHVHVYHKVFIKTVHLKGKSVKAYNVQYVNSSVSVHYFAIIEL